MSTREGDRVCNLGRYATEGPGVGVTWRPIPHGVIYLATRRQDGMLTWQRDGYFGDVPRRLEISVEYIDGLKSIAPHPWCSWAVQGKEIYLEERKIGDR